jgi:hypothetical protein
MQVSALGRPTVGVSSASGPHSCGEIAGYKVVRRASMYIGSRAGLGESEQKLVTTSSGDVAGRWLCEEGVPHRGGRVIGLRVLFRRSFADFRREVEQAVARWVPNPSVARQLVAASTDLLKFHHKQMLAESVPDNAPLHLITSFLYEASDCRWRVAKIIWPSERVRWERIFKPIREFRWTFR